MSENENRYRQIFCSVFDVENAALDNNLAYQEIPDWDALEDEFSIEMDIDDIIDFSSFEVGKTLLNKYGVTFA
ncbi:MAG: acyl carrier protein [Actinobacteria bacterium]|nr:acyl carrier protein [Actinomycetota bacterium]